MTNDCSKAMDLTTALNSLSAYLKDPCLIPSARILESSFSRKRKIPLHDLLGFEIFRNGDTIYEDIAFYFQELEEPPTNNAVLHREAILNYEIWRRIMEKQRELFYETNLMNKTYKEYTIIAVDGSKVELPASPALNQIFGGSLNRSCRTKEELKTPIAHLSAAFDVMNQQVLDFIIEPHNVSEIPMMKEHLDHLLPFLQGKKVIFLMDRYYGSVEFFRWCDLHGFYYVVRAKKNFFKDLRAEIPNDVQDSILEISLDKTWIRRLKDETVKESFKVDPSIDVRLVKNDYTFIEEYKRDSDDGKSRRVTYKEISVHSEYFTNLPGDLFPKDEIVHIYHDLRWDIETYYGRLKNDIKIALLHSRNPILIQNEIMGKVVLSNIIGAFYTVASDELDGNQYIPNYKRIINYTKQFSFLKLFMGERLTVKQIQRIITQAIRSKSRVKKGRHIRRWNRFYKSIPQKKYRIGGRSNPKIQPCRFGGFITIA